MVTRGDIGFVLGLAGFVLGGSAFYFGFKTNIHLADIDGVMKSDGDVIEQLVTEKTQLQRDLQEANKRISLGVESVAALQVVELRDAVRLAVALAELGRREGLDVLVDVVLRDPAAGEDMVDVRWRAGMKLNDLLSRTIVQVEHDVKPEDVAKARAKSLVAAADGLRTWWAAAKDRVRFDEATRTWKD